MMAMNLGNDDRNWLDSKFGEVHKRITDSREEQTRQLHEVTRDQNEKIAELKESLEVHKVEPCADVKTHEVKYHGSSDRRQATPAPGKLTGKMLGIIAALATAIATLAHLLAKLVGGG